MHTLTTGNTLHHIIVHQLYTRRESFIPVQSSPSVMWPMRIANP